MSEPSVKLEETLRFEAAAGSLWDEVSPAVP